MSTRTLVRILPVALLLATAAPAAAQTPDAFGADLLAEMEIAGSKMVGLTEAQPEANLNWRPAPGVRSVGEVFKHVIGTNYNLAYFLGGSAPTGSDITADYGTVVALEARELSKAEITRRMRASYEHLAQVIRDFDPATYDEQVDFFGESRTRRAVLVMFATHMHEHMGQSIAYARMNGVTPPWSN